MADTKKKTHMLTTVDNPYDPFDQWDQWFQWDTSHGYHTSSFLARVLISSEELSENDQDQDVEWAIDEIIAFNVNGKYRKVSREE